MRRLVGLVALGACSVWCVLLAWAALPATAGGRPVAVRSNSMAPGIRAGDIVVALPVERAAVAPGRVIVFRAADGGLVTHRVAEVLPAGYRTQGDANAGPDSDIVTRDDVVGVAHLRVPWVAAPVVWRHEGAWARLVGFAAVAVATLRAVRWAFR